MIQTSLSDRIISLGAADLQWPFDQGPRLSLRARWPKSFGGSVNVDPFPCYQHDIKLVAQIAAKVEALFPMEFEPNYYVLGFEDLGRTNGHSSKHWIYQNDDDEPKPPYEPYIVLSGKRIPLHPAMTRYLVAHEYGHVVNFYLEHKRGLTDHDQQFDREYAAMRGIEPSFKYGGGNWHGAIGEIIANDFRICVCGIEPEFWPHEVEHPDNVPAVQSYWREQQREFAWRGAGDKAA